MIWDNFGHQTKYLNRPTHKVQNVLALLPIKCFSISVILRKSVTSHYFRTVDADIGLFCLRSERKIRKQVKSTPNTLRKMKRIRIAL